MIHNQAVARRIAIQLRIEHLQYVWQRQRGAPIAQTAAREAQPAELVDQVERRVGHNAIASGQGIAQRSYDVYIAGSQALHGRGRRAGTCIIQRTGKRHVIGYQSLPFALVPTAPVKRLDIPQRPVQRCAACAEQQLAIIPIYVRILRQSIANRTQGIEVLGLNSNAVQQLMGAILAAYARNVRNGGIDEK